MNRVASVTQLGCRHCNDDLSERQMRHLKIKLNKNLLCAFHYFYFCAKDKIYWSRYNIKWNNYNVIIHISKNRRLLYIDVGSCPILPAMMKFTNKNQRMMVKITIQNELSRKIRVKAWLQWSRSFWLVRRQKNSTFCHRIAYSIPFADGEFFVSWVILQSLYHSPQSSAHKQSWQKIHVAAGQEM